MAIDQRIGQSRCREDLQIDSVMLGYFCKIDKNGFISDCCENICRLFELVHEAGCHFNQCIFSGIRRSRIFVNVGDNPWIRIFFICQLTYTYRWTLGNSCNTGRAVLWKNRKKRYFYNCHLSINKWPLSMGAAGHNSARFWAVCSDFVIGFVTLTKCAVHVPFMVKYGK